MYFSRVTLDGQAEPTESVLRALGSGYGLHQAIWGLFADSPDRRRDFLYHVESRSGPPTILTLSAREPRASDFGWQVRTKPYEPRVCVGSRLSFLLRVNPVRTREGRRHDVVMDEKRRLQKLAGTAGPMPSEADLVQATCSDWLSRRASGLGFRLLAVRADAYRQVELDRLRTAPIRFSTVDIAGSLEVMDPDLFMRRAVFEGIGPAKSFGCGLLLLRRG